MAVDPLLGNNRQATPIPDDIVANVFDRRVPKISLMVKTGEWALGTPVEKELTSRYLKQMAKNIVKGVAIGAFGGVVASPLGAGIVSEWSLSQSLMVGAGTGLFSSAGITYLRFKPRFRNVEELEKRLDERVKNILDELFNQYAEDLGEESILDPITYSIFHIPVRTLCNHVIEYRSLKIALQRSSSCPLCRREVRLDHLSLDRSTREKVKVVMERVFSLFDSQEGDILRSEEEYEAFLNMEGEIVERIKHGTLEDKDLKFLHHLITENVMIYNRKVSESYIELVSMLQHHLMFLGDDQYDNLSRDLREWKDTLKLSLGEGWV